MTDFWALREFVIESNRIEDIRREPTVEEINAHAVLLGFLHRFYYQSLSDGDRR